MSAPKVFVNHASEDKDRFVVEFARRLRENELPPKNGRHEVGHVDLVEDV